jgi:hypothetical protein
MQECTPTATQPPATQCNLTAADEGVWKEAAQTIRTTSSTLQADVRAKPRALLNLKVCRLVKTISLTMPVAAAFSVPDSV